MIFDQLMIGVEVEDVEFDKKLYSESIHNLSSTHFTPIVIAKESAQYLVTDRSTRVLDIGSGAGKFCMVGAACTTGYFIGVEQRKNLHQIAEGILKKYELPHIEFYHGNITEIDFSSYDAFYFYNPFYENVAQMDKIDDAIELKRELYKSYTAYVKSQLDRMPIGTRLVTYFSSFDTVPESYKVHTKFEMTKLVFWEKVT